MTRSPIELFWTAKNTDSFEEKVENLLIVTIMPGISSAVTFGIVGVILAFWVSDHLYFQLQFLLIHIIVTITITIKAKTSIDFKSSSSEKSQVTIFVNWAVGFETEKRRSDEYYWDPYSGYYCESKLYHFDPT